MEMRSKKDIKQSQESLAPAEPSSLDTGLRQSVTIEGDLHSGHVRLPDGELFYQMRGHGEPLVFIHGFSLDSRMWAGQVEHFCRSYRTLCYDVRGFGKSSKPLTQFTHHEDLKSLLESLQLEKVHLVGFSMGGRIALNFALHYPDSVESLAVFASNLEGARFDLRFQPDPHDIEVTKRSWLSHELFSSLHRYPELQRVVAAMVNDYSGWHWKHASLENSPEVKTIDRLHEIETRTLVVVGDADVEHAQTIARTLNSGLPNVATHTIPDCGHMLTLEVPDTCSRLLEKHLHSQSFGEDQAPSLRAPEK
jgi:3-oxoadipate enol-lactonase